MIVLKLFRIKFITLENIVFLSVLFDKFITVLIFILNNYMQYAKFIKNLS